MPRAISAGGPSQQGTPTTQDRPGRTDQGAQDLPLEWGLGAGSAIAPSPGREAALAWASLAQRFPASSVLARVG